jgi:hypothetical protein
MSACQETGFSGSLSSMERCCLWEFLSSSTYQSLCLHSVQVLGEDVLESQGLGWDGGTLAS